MAAGLLSFTLYGCGGSDTPVVVVPPVVPPVGVDAAAVIAAAAALPGNDITASTSASFTVIKDAGLSPVTINSAPVINFTVFYEGAVKTGLIAGPTGNNIRFMLSKLVPGANGSPDTWSNYIWGDNTGTAGPVGSTQNADGSWTAGTNLITDQTKARTSTYEVRDETKLVYNAAGYYTYTFTTDITDATRAGAKDSSGNAVVFEPGQIHRLSMQVSFADAAGETVRAAPYIDFTIGADGKSIAVANPKKVVDIRSCNNCHESLRVHGRVDTTMCIQCHQPGSVDKGGGETIDLMHMVHKLHAGKDLSKRYAIFGSTSVYEYSVVGFPQSINNCVKCHDGSADATGTNNKAFQTAQGDNWANVPNRAACGSCHDYVNFATGVGHSALNLPMATDAQCALCHAAVDIKLFHANGDATPNATALPVGAVNFTYEINSATVNASDQAVVKFRIKKDGANLNVSTQPAGFTGGPSFLLAYAMSQDGVTTPADYNNFNTVTGLYAAPKGEGTTVSLATLIDGTRGTLTAPDADGWQTATLTHVNGTFPAGAKMRAVSLQGYFTQTSIGSGRHTVSVVKAVTGDATRRTVVDSAKCANCHDWFLGHGGNRVYEVQVCVICHNPSKATSGRGISDAIFDAYAFSAGDLQKMALWGMNLTLPDKALQFPVVSNNMKDMIHGIHAMKDRTNPFRDARDRTPNAITLLDMSRIAFPGVLQNCETCHKAGTYNSVPAAALASVQESRNAAYIASATTAEAKLSLNLPNTGDLVSTPWAAACVSCHDSSLAKSHIGLNGGLIGLSATTETRSAMMAAGGPAGETCALCHSTGKIADAAVVHMQ